MKENKFVMGEEDHQIPTTATSPLPANTTTTTTHSSKAKPTRHHVKRRSSGRVHVAKLAPMARANAAQAPHTDSEADWGEETTEASTSSNNRPTMRRSQSQRSFHRMSFGGDRKGFAAITTSSHTRRKSTASATQQEKIMISSPSPPSSPPPAPREEELQQQQQQQQQQQHHHNETTTSSSNSTTHSTSNPASLSSRVIAAPIEQPIVAVANNLVVPKNPAYPTIVKSTSPLKSEVSPPPTITKQFLKSQFIPSSYDDEQQQEQGHFSSSLPKRYDSTFHMTPNSAASANNNNSRSPNNTITSVARTNSNPNMLSRTQQKLMLQRQQAQVEDETSPAHPRNMQKINKELESLSRQYRCLKRYQDPMRASLVRCLEKMEKARSAASAGGVNTATAAMNRLQLGANKYSMSLAMVPTVNTSATASISSNERGGGYIPHLEQKKQIAQQRRNHLNAIALQRQQSELLMLQRQQKQHQLEEAQAHAEEGGTDPGAVIWNATAAFLDRVFSSK